LTAATTPQKELGFLDRLRKRLNRGKSLISSQLNQTLGRGLDDEGLEMLEDELLLADVGVAATDAIVDRLRATRVPSGANPRQVLTTIVAELLRPLAVPLGVSQATRPFVVLVVGVNGTGKTTSIGKLAHRLRAQGLTVLLAAGDTFRAAAVEQLRAWGKKAGVPVFAQSAGADPAAVVHDALDAARARNTDVVIADTAGRLHTSSDLMEELKKIKRVASRFDAASPHEILLVLDASQGQNALVQARRFHEALGVTGLVLTKLDGTAKGGITLAIARELGLPVRFIALGESLEDFETFDAQAFAEALCGGDDA
jgi:fused signal recognition particle receptor